MKNNYTDYTSINQSTKPLNNKTTKQQNMNKKLYIKPLCLAVEVETSSIICMSVYDEEAPFVGAKHNTFHDDFEESENLEGWEEE